MLLEVDEIHTAYGQSRILFGVSLEVAEGEVVALMGRNGVGKSTTLRSIIGLAPPCRGRIVWKGVEITGTPPHRISRMGIAWVPEDRRIFPELTVAENLDVATARPHPTPWTVERVVDLFPDLAALMNRPGGHLSGGQQQMLTIARSLMVNPDLLLLDEPSEGLAPLVVRALFDRIAALRAERLSIVLAEQNLDFVLGLADRVYILEKGRVRFCGTAAEVRADAALQRRYLTV